MLFADKKKQELSDLSLISNCIIDRRVIIISRQNIHPKDRKLCINIDHEFWLEILIALCLIAKEIIIIGR